MSGLLIAVSKCRLLLLNSFYIFSQPVLISLLARKTRSPGLLFTNRAVVGTSKTSLNMTSTESLKKSACDAIDAAKQDLISTSRQIWEKPELAYKEHNSSKLLIDFLERKGFQVRHRLRKRFKWYMYAVCCIVRVVQPKCEA